MWKWILGVLCGLVIAFLGVCYWAYGHFTAGGNIAQVTIGKSADRIFPLLADPDSLKTWSSSSGTVKRGGTGLLQAGDTIVMPVTIDTTRKTRTEMNRWVVRKVQIPTLLVMDNITAPDAYGRTKIGFSRRDSLATKGDSTVVFSIFTSPLLGAASDSGGVAGQSIGAVNKLVLSTMRQLRALELRNLKRRLEAS